MGKLSAEKIQMIGIKYLSEINKVYEKHLSSKKAGKDLVKF